MQEIRASFFVECDDLLEAMQDGLAQLEDGGRDAETINVVFRAVHSIKGGAGAFGLEDLVAFAHTVETLLDEMRAERLAPEPNRLRLLFKCADALSDLVRSARDDTPPDHARIAALRTQLEGEAASPPSPDAPAAFEPVAITLDIDSPADAPPPPAPETGRAWRISFAPRPELYSAGHEPLFLLRALSELGSCRTACHLPDVLPGFADYDASSAFMRWDVILTTTRDETAIRDIFEFADGLCDLEIGPTGGHVAAETADSPPDGTTAPAPSLAEAPVRDTGTRGTKPTATVRVDLDRIERLVNLVGELVINQAMLSQSVSEAGLAADPGISAGLDEFLQLTRDIQDSVMMIRAQPVKSLFQRMGRIVREASDAVGKSVRLVTEGDATEIDKTMLERLSDPLTHMVRNAVDHGLESADTRRAADKAPEGTITLTAKHRSGRVIIEIRDDGAGIDRRKVQRIAEERGLIPRGLALSDPEVDNLLFLPGFSTASAVSNLSGRGVGMDVVKSTIATLGGRLSITSVPGRGSTFSISLPLTLAVLDGMVVETGGETLVVPLGAITETLSLCDDDLVSVGPGITAIHVRECFVPLVDLAAHLGYAPARRSYASAIAILVTQDDRAQTALVVDRIVDQRQVVIKGLEDSYGRVPGVAAATILGDGRIALILDPSDLASRPARHGAPPHLLAATG